MADRIEGPGRNEDVSVPRWIVSIVLMFRRLGDRLIDVKDWFLDGWDEHVASRFRQARANWHESRSRDAEPDGEPDPIEDAEDRLLTRRIRLLWLVVVGVAVVVAGFAFMAWRGFNPGTGVKQASAETTATASATGTPKPTNKNMVDNGNAIMRANGWKDGQYQIGSKVDESRDKSTAGNGSFTAEGVKNPAGMVAFLKSGSKGAQALMACIIGGTDATKEEVLDERNWIAVQATVDFTYPSNTSLEGAKVIGAGARGGSKGDIFLIFCSPSSGKAVAVRGACGNAQVVIPRPVKFTPPSKPTPKPGLKVKVWSDDAYPHGKAPRAGGPSAGSGKPTPKPANPPATYTPPKPPPAATTPPVESKPDPTPAPPDDPAVEQDPPSNGRV